MSGPGSKVGRQEVRILLVGDRNVGKTSLILSLVSEEFPIDVPAKAEEITIPEKVPTCIVDYSSSEQNDSQLEAELEKADVVCIVYSVDDEDSLDSVTDHWLPLLRVSLGDSHTTPVILVGNKVDQVDYTTMEAVMPIMNDYEEIETCVECSARNLKNISEVFYFAQKAVLHPSAPLWNYHDKDLTEACKRALFRIFKICDMDNDGILSDEELARFQQRCFNMDLEPGTLESLKAVVVKNCPEGIQNEGLTSKGFLTLNSLFIQRGRHETTWTILRKFGYCDDLHLAWDQLVTPVLPTPGSPVELTSAGLEFLSNVFNKHDLDHDGCLNNQELISLFSTCPVMPWGPEVYYQVPLSPSSSVAVYTFMAWWNLLCLTQPEKCAELLAHLGFDYLSQHLPYRQQPLLPCKDKKSDLAKRQTSKTVYSCLVVGPRDAGKTTFCQRFLGRSLEDTLNISPEDKPKSLVNSVLVYGQQKYLVMLDADVLAAADGLDSTQTNCDVVCLVYDASNPRSFEYCARIYLRYFSTTQVPVLVVANKSDQGVVRQDYILQPEAFCAKHKLPPPQKSSARAPVTKDIFIKLATMAAFPNLRRLVHAMISLKRPPGEWLGILRHLKQLGLVGEDSGMLKLTFGFALLALGGIFAFRYFANRYIEGIPTKRVTRYGESCKKEASKLESEESYQKRSTFDVLSTSDYSSGGSSEQSIKSTTSPLSNTETLSYKHFSLLEQNLTDNNVQSVHSNDWDSDAESYQDAQHWERFADFQHYDQIKGHTIVADSVYLLTPHESINCQNIEPSHFSISTHSPQVLSTGNCQLYKTLQMINISPIVQISPPGRLFSTRHPAYLFIPLTHHLDSECRKKVSCLTSTSSSDQRKVDWRRIDADCYKLSECNNYLIVKTCVLGFFAVVFEEDAEFTSKKILRRLGGELKLNSVKISFPRGSCSEDIEARVKVLHDKEPSHPENVVVPGLLACPIVMLSPGGYNFNKNVTIELPVPNYRRVKEIEPKAELKVFQSCTRNGEALKWEELEPNKTSINTYKNGVVTFSFTVSHFSFFKIFWDIMGKNIQKLGYFSNWIAFPMKCEAYMEENKDTNTFGLDVACFNPDKSEETQRSTYKYKVGSSLKPKLVKPGNILCKLNSQKFLPDTEAGEDDVMEKVEENFRGDDFNKQFALLFHEKLRVERGTFGKVMVDRVDCDKVKLENLFEFNLTKQGIETEARPRHSDVWSMIAIKELAGNMGLTDENNWKKFAAYIGCTRSEIDFITRTKGDPFVEMMKQYQERGGTAEDFMQSLYAVSRDLVVNSYNSSGALPSSPGSGSSSGVSGSGSQNSQHSQGHGQALAANMTRKFSLFGLNPWRNNEDSDSGTADHHHDLTPSTKVNTTPSSSKESRKRGHGCEKTPSLSKRRKTERSPMSRLSSHHNDSYSSSDESGAEQDARDTKAKTISTERHIKNMYKFSDNDLWKVSGEMASINWRALGRTLGLEESILVNLEHSYKSQGMKECVYQMLREWKEKKPRTCTFGSLYAALTTEKMNYIAKSLVKLLEEGNFKKPN